MGTMGQMTDAAQTRMPLGALLIANNVTLRHGLLEKEPGSYRWNITGYGSPVIAVHDFWPDDVTQRLFTFTEDNTLRKHIDRIHSDVITPATVNDPQMLTHASDKLPMFIAGGVESSSTVRKLFLFTGNTQVQVILGDGLTRASISKPALDWTTSFPSTGVLYNGRLCAFYKHTLYMSNPDDHEDFQTGGAFLQFPVFPGEGDAILGGYVFKGRLFIFKAPFGVYFLDDSAGPDFTTWAIRKLTGSFGAASAFSVFEALNDAYVANYNGSVTQMSATLNFGSMETGDLMRNLQIEGYMRQTTARFGFRTRYAVYYEDKKLGLVAYRSSGGTQNDLLLVVDFNDPNGPRVTWSNKDKPRCLGLMRDTLGIVRPIYGSVDGFVYRWDWPTYDVAGTPYKAEFTTVNMDFGQSDPALAERMKLYDFLEVTFGVEGSWNLTVDVYIDEEFSETIQFSMFKQGSTNRYPRSLRLPLHGTGRRIGFHCYNTGLDQGFSISELGVYFRPAGNAQES